MYRSARLGRALVFCGNMCAVPSVWLSISPHIKFYIPVPFLCRICPSYGYGFPISHIDMTHAFPIDMIIIYWICFGFSFGLFWDAIRLIWPLLLSNWYDEPIGFLFDFYWIFSCHSLIDMTLDQNFPIGMTAHSYWYEGKERRFFTLCYLSIRQSFFLSLGQENLKVIFSKRESSLQVIWPFILGIENTLDLTVNPRPKTLNFLSFQSDRRFVKKNLLKSI